MQVDPIPSAFSPQAAASVQTRGAWVIVGLLTLVYLLSYVDRQILALLIEPIKADLQIDDLRFSFLTGLAFSVFFAVAGVPLGWASDTFRRNRVIGAGILCWSLATIASGLADSYGHIFIARILVGVGEAALTPAAYSLIADIVAPAMLGRAIAVFSMGSQFGAATAYLLGGGLVAMLSRPGAGLPLFGDLAVWKQMFVIVGLPGLVLAPVILFGVRDPRRNTAADRVSLAAAWAQLKPQRAFLVRHYCGFTALAAAFFSIMAWLPAMLGRRLGLDAAHLGLTAGALVLVCCPLGTLTAGWLADRLSAAYGRSAPLRAAIIGMLVMVPAMVIIAVAGSGPMLMLGTAMALFVAPWPLVHASQSLQTSVPPRVRAQITALFLLIANLIGQTGGVSLVALLTDKVLRDPAKVHLSLAAVCIVAMLLAWQPLRSAAALVREARDV
ncbi:Major facilitator superfamily protein [Novosphingobium resinovorum]|uniref:Major facilitator superfamily protein n=1 Tax=Novosphingobium resinovorum TaxID=158500 RepID=A0A031JPG6_9SPHN|nr:Major facilitator superfamily protein [Novosphingobium resinovorum]